MNIIRNFSELEDYSGEDYFPLEGLRVHGIFMGSEHLDYINRMFFYHKKTDDYIERYIFRSLELWKSRERHFKFFENHRKNRIYREFLFFLTKGKPNEKMCQKYDYVFQFFMSGKIMGIEFHFEDIDPILRPYSYMCRKIIDSVARRCKEEKSGISVHKQIGLEVHGIKLVTRLADWGITRSKWRRILKTVYNINSKSAKSFVPGISLHMPRKATKEQKDKFFRSLFSFMPKLRTIFRNKHTDREKFYNIILDLMKGKDEFLNSGELEHTIEMAVREMYDQDLDDLFEFRPKSFDLESVLNHLFHREKRDEYGFKPPPIKRKHLQSYLYIYLDFRLGNDPMRKFTMLQKLERMEEELLKHREKHFIRSLEMEYFSQEGLSRKIKKGSYKDVLEHREVFYTIAKMHSEWEDKEWKDDDDFAFHVYHFLRHRNLLRKAYGKAAQLEGKKMNYKEIMTDYLSYIYEKDSVFEKLKKASYYKYLAEFDLLTKDMEKEYKEHKSYIKQKKMDEFERAAKERWQKMTEKLQPYFTDIPKFEEILISSPYDEGMREAFKKLDEHNKKFVEYAYQRKKHEEFLMKAEFERRQDMRNKEIDRERHEILIKRAEENRRKNRLIREQEEMRIKKERDLLENTDERKIGMFRELWKFRSAVPTVLDERTSNLYSVLIEAEINKQEPFEPSEDLSEETFMKIAMFHLRYGEQTVLDQHLWLTSWAVIHQMMHMNFLRDESVNKINENRTLVERSKGAQHVLTKEQWEKHDRVMKMRAEREERAKQAEKEKAEKLKMKVEEAIKHEPRPPDPGGTATPVMATQERKRVIPSLVGTGPVKDTEGTTDELISLIDLNKFTISSNEVLKRVIVGTEQAGIPVRKLIPLFNSLAKEVIESTEVSDIVVWIHLLYMINYELRPGSNPNLEGVKSRTIDGKPVNMSIRKKVCARIIHILIKEDLCKDIGFYKETQSFRPLFMSYYNDVKDTL